MNRVSKNVSRALFFGILVIILLLAGSCQNWMSNDDFMSKIENEVHDANAAPVSVYVRYANSKMGTSEPSGYTTMKVDVAHELNAVTSDDYGFVKWAAFSTKSFSPTKQHSALFYESAQDYNKKYKPLELGSNEVLFTDPKSPSTKVKIYSERNDIFIIPIVAKRPALVTSVPSNGRSDVVRNTQIRILFSKPIDEKTLVDEYGNSNIEITSGSAVLTESSEDLSAKDITDLFDITLGSTKKMLTLSLKPGENNTKVFLDGNSQISITIYEDVCDTDGYSLNGNTSFSFTTGTKFDSLAPYITILKAGAGQNCQNFEQYHYNKTAGTGEYNYTAAAENAPTDLNSYVNQPSGEVRILDQRIQNSVNIWVQAIDIQGSGSGVGKGADVTSENNVAQIQVRAKVVSKANASDNRKIEAAAKTFLYAMGNKDTDCQINQSFETATGTNSGGQITKNSKGTLFTYGLDDLADGLIKIDLWAVDMVGNSGITEQNDYIAEYNNGYRSIFVVKDSTAPNATTNKTYVVPTGNASTSGYYNATTYAAIKIAGNTSITDQGNSYLSSPNSKLKWIVMPKEDTTWVKTISTDDPRWKYVTENYSGFPLPDSDGPVTLTYALMDDLGNISDAITLDAIKYDGTDPVLSALKFNPDNDYEEGIANANVLRNQTLVIPANEITSGIKSIELFVTKDSETQAFTSPFDGAEITRNDGVTLSSSQYSITNNKLTFTTPLTNFNTDLLIKKLKIYGSTTEGKYTVKVKIADAADNYKETTIEQNTTVSLDSTKPLIQSVYIPDIKKAVQSNDPSAYAWIDYNSTNLTKTDTALFAKSIYITFKENNSGAKVFSFNNSSIKLTDASKLYKVTSTSATTGTEIAKKDITNNVLTLKDKITSEGTGSVIAMITNVQLAPDGSNLNLYITDRAKNVDENAFSDISSDNSIVTTSFKYDSSEPGIELTELKDNNIEVTQIPAQDGFTNNAYINASVTVTPTDSGVYALTITSDSPAVFDNTTEICAATNTDVKYKFDPLSGDSKTICFNNGAATNSKPMYLAHANNDPIGLVIMNLKLTGADGDKKIKIKATSFGGVPHTCEEKSIQLDTEPPEWNEKGIYGVYENDEKSDTIWPHPKTEQKIYGVTFDNNDNDIYFYKKTSMTVGFDIKQKEKNYLGTKWHPDSDATSFETHETLTHTVNANGVWVVYAYDKAGNKTSDKNIHFVLDDSFAPGGYAVIDNYMTIVAPDSSSKVFRNDTESSESHSTNYNYYNSNRGTTDYPLTSHQFIIKKTTNPYQIKVKLGKRTNGVKAITTADTWLDGTNPTSTTQLDSFGYTNVTQSASPIEYYSITHQYRTYPSYPSCPERVFEPEEKYDFVWHKYEKNANGQKNQNNGDIYSYIDDDGDIVIELPINISCPPLTLFLKDGCGNKIFRYIRPSGFSYDYYSVSWMVDDTIGNSSDYSGTLSTTGYPDSIVTYADGNINYYKSSGYINITDVNDRCRFSTGGESTAQDITDGRYTLRSRIMAWGGTGEPAQDKFYKNDNNTLKEDVVALSDWKGYKQSGSSTAFALNNIKFPSVDSNTPYELWYILEDTVGNCRKAKLTNGDASKWQYDNLPPLVDITGTTKVNRFNDNNYYSSSSSVTYQVEDVKSGVKNDGQKTYNYSERQTLVQGKTLSIGNKTPDSNGNLEFPEVEDFAGNKTTSILSNNAVLTWKFLNEAPAFVIPTEQSPNPITSDTAVIKDKNNKTVGQTNSLLNKVTTTYNSTDKIIQHTINSQITNNKVTVELLITDATNQPLLGWVVKNDPLNQFKDFYAVGDSDITTITNNIYEFTKTDSNKSWQEAYATPTYFYPVNRAGLICKTAVCIKFENPATPALNGNITYSDVTDYVNGDTKINYFKGTSKLTIPVKNNTNRCYIIYGSGTSDYIEYDLTKNGSKEITLNNTVYSSMTGSNGTLKIKLFADYEGYYVESNEIGITGPAGKNCWVYDVTAPDFSLVSVKSKSSSSTDTTIYDSVKTGDVYYLAKKCPVIKFNYTHTDIKTYQYKASDAQDWTTMTLDQNKTFSDTTNFTIPDNTTKTYNFRAIDRAGNISTQIDIQLNRDKTVPSGTLSGYSLNGTENADYIKEDDTSTPPVTTIKYNPDKVNSITLSLTDISDTGAGIDSSDYLYYKTGGNETKLTSTSISLPNNLNNTEYEIIIKDKFGNAKTLKKFKFTAYKEGPKLPSDYKATHLPYSGLASTPVYPGTYSASNETNWITGFKKGGDNYAITSGSTATITEQSEDPIWVYENGKPKNQGSPKNYSITNFTTDNPKFTLPVDYSSMPSKKLWYAITYMTFDVDENATIIPPESSSWTATWTEVADVSSGKIENVPIDTSKVEWNHTFIFVWYKDQFGHISVHALTNPKTSDTWNETWWTYETTGGQGGGGGGGQNPNISSSKGLSMLQGIVAGNNSSGRSGSSIARRPVFESIVNPVQETAAAKLVDKALTVEKPVTKAAPKAAPKTVAKKAPKAAPKKAEEKVVQNITTQAVAVVQNTVEQAVAQDSQETPQVMVAPDVPVSASFAAPVVEAKAPLPQKGHSATAIILVILALCAAVAGIAVCCKKRGFLVK